MGHPAGKLINTRVNAARQPDQKNLLFAFPVQTSLSTTPLAWNSPEKDRTWTDMHTHRHSTEEEDTPRQLNKPTTGASSALKARDPGETLPAAQSPVLLQPTTSELL
jgi:hypothetical protein